MFSKIQVKINNLTIGGNSPVRVESMLKIALPKHEECLAQCESLLNSGCELARVALPDKKLAQDLKWLVENSKLTLMADIHFDPAIAISAMEAGCRAIRINPGNMPLNKLNDVIETAKKLGVVIRIGANGGSISQAQLEQANGDRAEALFIAVREQAELLLKAKFENIILSAKSVFLRYVASRCSNVCIPEFSKNGGILGFTRRKSYVVISPSTLEMYSPLSSLLWST